MKNGFFKYVFASMLGFIFAYIVIIIIGLSIMLGTISYYSQKLIKDDKSQTLKKGSILTIKLDAPIVERSNDIPFYAFSFIDDDMVPLSLKDIVDKIEKAGTDDNISGIMLHLGLVTASGATLEEVRNALINFKKSGKFIYSYSEIITQSAYYLISVADKVFLEPEGELIFNGKHAEMVYLKGMFDKLGVQATLIRVGKYKSAGEIFTRTDMSPEDRKQNEELYFPLYDRYISKIAESRKIDLAELRSIADEMKVQSAKDALSYKLVDQLGYKDEVIKELKTLTKKDKLHMVTLNSYHPNATKENKKEYTKDKIAIIYAVGNIGFGKGNSQSIGSEGLSKAIRQAREDKNIKAIVLRINSPGGGSLASDVIWREVKLAADKKPLIVSMGDLAASGGYYIAVPAKTIVAQPNTITGSIGVFGVHINAQDFWKNKTGVSFDRIKTGKYSDLGNPNRPLTADELAIIQNSVNEIYQGFLNRVAEGRKMDIKAVDSIAQGRVWSGEQAIKIGLVDKLGGLNDAIEIAAKDAKVSNYRIVILPKAENPFSSLMSMTQSNLSEHLLKYTMGKDYELYKEIKNLQEMTSGTYMLCPYSLNSW